MNLGQIRAAALTYLGVSSTDKAFLPANVNRWINDARNEVVGELPPGYAVRTATWTPDSATARIYTLASQGTPVTALRRVLALCLETADGARLREVQYDQLREWPGYTYAVTGADEVAVLTVGADVSLGQTLWAEYEVWPTELASDSDTPSEIPARYHDVLALMAAEVGFASGDEGKMPSSLVSRLQDRRAQLWAATGRRSADVMKMRQSAAL